MWTRLAPHSNGFLGFCFEQKTVVDKQEKRNQDRIKRREEREKEERMKKR